ncbi:hypothetical protein [Peptostreptococcus faecalis]|uniref:hypothetical protein n=1 Tax=Peptostreptococcus faecalis TaxID=2045015 RepID=UPI000C797FD9|nr:hypothetical protein [Peptostreptococcus faecalis]
MEINITPEYYNIYAGDIVENMRGDKFFIGIAKITSYNKFANKNITSEKITLIDIQNFNCEVTEFSPREIKELVHRYDLELFGKYGKFKIVNK